MIRTTIIDVAGCLLLPLAMGLPAAHAEPRLYGFSAGAALDLDPKDRQPGIAIGLSATIPVGDNWEQPLRARGRLVGMLTPAGWAVIPSLSGEATARLGPVELSMDAGLHIFGLAHRGEETIFSILGVRGGVGLMVQPQPTWRLGFRGDLSWLPNKFSSPIDDSAKDASNTYLYLSILATVELLTEFDN